MNVVAEKAAFRALRMFRSFLTQPLVIYVEMPGEQIG